jgi:tetratricopeptide (TPR) repeat protein
MSLLAAEPTFVADPASPLLELVREIEEAVRQGASPEDMGRLRSRGVQLIAAHPRSHKDPASVAAACQVVELCLAAGWIDRPASASLAGEAAKANGQGWTGLLAALLLAPAWQISALPAFDATPLFLWRTLALAVFRVPAALTELGQAETMGRQQLSRLRELARLAEFNPGAAALREAAQAALAPGELRPLHTAAAPLHEALICRGRVRAALHRRIKSLALPALSRSGRRLKLGVVLENLINDRRWRAILPWFEALDGSRFETVVFFSGKSDPAAESYLSAREISFRRLLGEVAEHNLQLQAEGLDIALASLPSPGTVGPLADLFAERVAPVQASCDEFGFTSGTAEFDVALRAGPLFAPLPVYSERLLVAPVTGGRLLPAELKGQLSQTWTRTGLGFAADSVIYASVAPFALLSPEWADRAARRLAEEPAARLLIYSGAAEDSGAAGMSRICAVLEPALRRHQVEAARLMISNEALGSWAEVESLLGLADFHFDSFPLGDPDGQLQARGAGLAPAGERAGAGSEFHDPLAFGEAVGALLESAFDQSVADEARPGRRNHPALTVELKPVPEGALEEAAILLEAGLAADALPRLAPWFAGDPSHPRARALFYAALIGAGQARRALIGLNAEVAARCADAATWRNLARAHLALGAREAAMAALRTSLKLDSRQPDSWTVLTEIAETGGHHALSEEVARMRALLAEQTPAEASAPARRCLYFSPVGKAGKAILKQIVELFPAEQFDFLIVGYDDTDFSDLDGRIELIRDRGQKWRLIKKHLTPEKVAAYDYVFMWDDDILPVNFDPVEFVSILRRNRLDIAQASLTADSYSFHPITVAHPNAVGRLTNFVEIMCPVYSSKIWPSIYPYIEPDINELGWGYDLIPLGRKAIVDCMTVRHTRPGQSALAGAAQQGAVWAQRHGIQRPALVNLWNLT